MNPQPRTQARGFSLIELLLAMVIVAILATVLIPAIGKVRSSAYSSQCASNLRQIHSAILLYATDNDGTLPGPTSMGQSPYFYSSSNSTTAGLAALLRSYLTEYRSAPEKGGNWWKQDIFSCPAWEAADGHRTPSASSPGSTAYLLNLTPWPPDKYSGGSQDVRPFGDTNSSSNPTRNKPRRMHDIAEFPLEQTWMLVDADNQFISKVMNYGTSSNYINQPAHGESSNVLYYDGRVEKVLHDDFRRYPWLSQ